jgi:hypothetical protein
MNWINGTLSLSQSPKKKAGQPKMCGLRKKVVLKLETAVSEYATVLVQFEQVKKITA